jgi:predicted dehydrogenase/threonine dehydrogenase-like Zn-dependent dehydrogenase
MKVKEAKLSLAGKARARPEQVRQVMDTVSQQGPVAAYKKVMNKLDSYTPLGYSLCGVVEQVGAGAEEFSVGQLVACAGNEYALHADVNWVPVNLCVPVPDGVNPQLAAFATVGAIAMQGVRRCEAQLGDTACVIGLGLVGQLAVQLLVAAGVRVVGLDTVAERNKMAEQAGAMACDTPDPEGLDRIARVLAEATGGHGADHVLLVAGGNSNGPVEAAAKLARDRATVVDIGKVRLDLPWNAYYDKELDVRFSRSYGPGRYDDNYELGGIDYPVGYVRWTERRNLACFVDLLDRGQLDIDSLVSGSFPVEEAVDVYDKLASGDLKGVGFLFEYPDNAEEISSLREKTSNGHVPASVDLAPTTKNVVKARTPGRRATVGIGFIGAGNYASSMLLPHFKDLPGAELRHVATNRSLSALDAKRRFGFAHASTDAQEVLSDDSVDTVFIVTRHHSHAELTCRALRAGKAVFVEKPLALTEEQLIDVLETIESTGNDRLMVGFNRRFAPLLTQMKSRFGSTSGGAVGRYSVNAGTLGARSWYTDEKLEGSRFAGEGGHFIDTLSWWFDALPTEVFTMGSKDLHDIQTTIRFSNGSIGTIFYVTNGNPRFPKEVLEVSDSGRTARLDNFRRGGVWSGRRKNVMRALGSIDKGQAAQVAAFLDAIRSDSKMPISIDSLAATTRATFAVATSQSSGRTEQV